MSNILPDITPDEKMQLNRVASMMVNTKGRPVIGAYLLVTFVENAKLVKEVNRLRGLVGETLLPVYEPKAS
jgi:hypothetical protein